MCVCVNACACVRRTTEEGLVSSAATAPRIIMIWRHNNARLNNRPTIRMSEGKEERERERERIKADLIKAPSPSGVE